MIIYKGGMIVGKGSYWNPANGRQVNVLEDSALPGGEDRRYMKMSPAALLVLAPLVGMTFVMFLPLFGIGVFLILWLVPLIAGLTAVAMTGIRICSRFDGGSLFFNWNPSRANFSGSQKRKKSVRRGTRSITGERASSQAARRKDV